MVGKRIPEKTATKPATSQSALDVRLRNAAIRRQEEAAAAAEVEARRRCAEDAWRRGMAAEAEENAERFRAEAARERATRERSENERLQLAIEHRRLRAEVEGYEADLQRRGLLPKAAATARPPAATQTERLLRSAARPSRSWGGSLPLAAPKESSRSPRRGAEGVVTVATVTEPNGRTTTTTRIEHAPAGSCEEQQWREPPIVCEEQR